MNKWLFGLFFLNMIFLSTFSRAVEKGITFQGSIQFPDGSYPSLTGQTANLKVLSSNGCILREENHTNVTVANGYVNLVIGTGTVGGSDPGFTFQKVLDNTTSYGALVCVNDDGSLNGAVTSYTPVSSDTRKLRLEMTLSGNAILADFNMKSVPYAMNAESLNGKTESDFIQKNNSQGVTQSNVESIFSRFAKLDNILGSFNASGNSLTGDISGTASNVSGIVAVANGGTGASSASSARTNLGLAAIASSGSASDLSTGTVPTARLGTGTASSSTYLRGDGAWATVSAGGSGTVTNVSGTAPINVSNGTTTPTITIDTANTTTTGALSSTDWNTFNNKLGTGTSFSGDVSGIYNSTSVDKIKGTGLTITTLTSGNYLKYNGTAWINSMMGFSELTGKPTTLSGYGITDAVGTSSVIDIAHGGTNATTAAAARSNLGLGTSAIVNTGSAAGDLPVLSTGGLSANKMCTADGTAAGVICTSTIPTSSQWTTNGSDVYYNSGNVGVGTSSPSANLHVVKGGVSNTVLGAFDFTGGNVGSTNENSALIRATTNSTFRPLLSLVPSSGVGVLVTAVGDVGIGTTSPASKLDVQGEVKFGNTSSTCNSTNEGQQRYNSTSRNMEFCNGTSWTAYSTGGGGGGGLSGCPASYTLVQPSSTYGTNAFCINPTNGGANSLNAAVNACTSSGASLCLARQIKAAHVDNVGPIAETPWTSNTMAYSVWVGDRYYTSWGTAGYTANLYGYIISTSMVMTPTDASGGNAYYCCTD